jgi:hypothetical protein
MQNAHCKNRTRRTFCSVILQFAVGILNYTRSSERLAEQKVDDPASLGITAWHEGLRVQVEAEIDAGQTDAR